MPQHESLEKLVATGLLKREPPGREEVSGLIRTASARLADAEKDTNAPESRFDLAYNAAHALSLAALRMHGFRAEKRFIVFQALQHTLGVDAPAWRLLDCCHRERNVTEYEGVSALDVELMIRALDLRRSCEALPRAPSTTRSTSRTQVVFSR